MEMTSAADRGARDSAQDDVKAVPLRDATETLKRRQPVDLDRCYGRIGIPAVVAALAHRRARPR